MKAFSIQYGNIVEAIVKNGKINDISVPLPDDSVLLVSQIKTNVRMVNKSSKQLLIIYDFLSLGNKKLTDIPIKERLKTLLQFANSKTKTGFPPLVRTFSSGVGIAIQTKEAGFKKSLTGKNPNAKSTGVLIKDDNETQTGWRVIGMDLGSINTELNYKERTPVAGESDRMQSYLPIIVHFIKSMGKSWRHCKTKNHISSSFPYTVDDLMQIGMTETIVAIRKYNKDFGTSESTFVYEHLSRNFAQIRRNFSGANRGYNIATVEIPANI